MCILLKRTALAGFPALELIAVTGRLRIQNINVCARQIRIYAFGVQRTAVCIIGHIVARHILGVKVHVTGNRIGAAEINSVAGKLRIGVPANKGVRHAVLRLCCGISIGRSRGIAGVQICSLHICPCFRPNIHKAIAHRINALCNNADGTVYMVAITVVGCAGNLIGRQNNGFHIVFIGDAAGSRKSVINGLPCRRRFRHGVSGSN